MSIIETGAGFLLPRFLLVVYFTMVSFTLAVVFALAV